MTDCKDQYDRRGTLINVADQCEKTDHIELKALRRRRRNAANNSLLALTEVTAREVTARYS